MSGCDNPQHTTTTSTAGRTTFSIPTIVVPPSDHNHHQDSTNDNDQTNNNCNNKAYDTLLNASSSSSDASSLLSVRHFTLACFGTNLNGYYYPIYNSNIDGLSFNRLLNAILGYGGPTVVLIQSVSGGIFGAYTGTAWKERPDFYGSADAFLFQLQPQVAVYRPKSSGTTTMSSSSSSSRGNNTSSSKSSGNKNNDTANYMYCNSSARSRGYDQLAHGIGFGGTVNQPRLFLAENLDDCEAGSQDLTYDNGPLLPPVGTSGHNFHHRSNNNNNNNATIQRDRSRFDVECIEVFGVSDQMDVIHAAIGSRTVQRANQEELIRKARQVDKAQFLDDFQSGMIASKAFVHRQQIDGRANDDDDCIFKRQQQP